MLERSKYRTHSLIRSPLTLLMFSGFYVVKYAPLAVGIAFIASVISTFVSFSVARLIFYSYLFLMTLFMLSGISFLTLLSVQAKKRESEDLLFTDKKISDMFLDFGNFPMANMVVGFFWILISSANGEGVYSGSWPGSAQLYFILFIMIPMLIPLIVRRLFVQD